MGDASMTRNENVSYDLFARLLIKRIVGYLEQKPSDFAITILPPMPTFPEREAAGDQTAGSDSLPSSSLESLSAEQRSLLEASIVLMHEPGATGESISHLGLEAQKLPLLARVLRKAYRQAKKKTQTASSAEETEELFLVTSCLLLIQPDHATAWADRRRCLLSIQDREIQGHDSSPSKIPRDGEDKDDDDDEDDNEKDASLALWTRELDYLDTLFTQHSKAPSSWAHRKYALRQILQRVEESYQTHGDIEKANKIKDIIFAREVKTCINIAEKYPKNYYAWTHRRYLWDLFSFESSTAGSEVWFSRKYLGQSIGDVLAKERRQQQRQRYIQLLETEWMIGMWQEWLPIHPADHSAVHYACQILDLLLDAMISFQMDSKQPLMNEKIESVSVLALDQVRELLSKFSQENESLWILRRITYKILLKHLYSPSNTKQISGKEFSSVRLLIRKDLKSILSSMITSDVEDQQAKLQNDGENDSNKVSNTKSIYAWTFIAWCIVNVKGIDDDRERATNDNIDASCDDVIFTPRVRDIASEYLTSTMGVTKHNHLVYTTSSSPISKILAPTAT